MSQKLKGFKLFADGQEIGTATKVTLPAIDPVPLCRAIEQFSGAMRSLKMKLKASNFQHTWFGFDGCAEYYKEQAQKKNRQLLSGTCIGEIK